MERSIHEQFSFYALSCNAVSYVSKKLVDSIYILFDGLPLNDDLVIGGN